MARRAGNRFYDALKARRHQFVAEDIIQQFRTVSEERVDVLAVNLAQYIQVNLSETIKKRNGLVDYRTNPYVLMTSASLMNLGDPSAFANYLFNSKLYMSLETSFGKSIETTFVSPYPLNSTGKWEDAPEKIAEFAKLVGLSREEKAARRRKSVWREIDKTCVIGNRRYLISIKSGPNTINDTQVQAMTQAIIDHHQEWGERSRANISGVQEIDIVLGLTYGTDRTTNNKENQILVKLLDAGFEEEDRTGRPGVLIDSATRSIRVYRHIGRDFWSFIGNPENPSAASFVYLEVLLALAKALSTGMETTDLESQLNMKLRQLSAALTNLQFPRNSLPEWVREDFSDNELFWFATAMTAFFDEGI